MLERSVEKATRGLKPFLFARNPTLNSDAAPVYKHKFGPHGGPLPHLWNIAVKHIITKLWWNKAKGSKVNRR